MHNEGNNPSWDVNRGCMDPLVNVRESREEIIVTADLPCVEKEDISLKIEENLLHLNAEMKKAFQFDNWGGFHREVKFNSFKKTIVLPSSVNPATAETSFKNSILRVRIKKKKGKKIEIE
ncbi:MAG: Hsp20/alpha crystallin family protein [Candidatus Hadarchaeia archaeon]